MVTILGKIFFEFTASLVFYLAVIDPFETDHFGRLALTLNGLHNREKLIVEKNTRKEIPPASLLLGGYDQRFIKQLRRIPLYIREHLK